MESSNPSPPPNRGRLLLRLFSRFVPGFIALGAYVFSTAGSLAYVNGWLFLGTFSVLMPLSLAYLFARDPGLLEKRMKTKESQKPQRAVILASLFVNMAVFGLPGLDWRFGWSCVPPLVIAAALVAMVGGYALYIATLMANSFASRVVEVQEGQRVIATGPYAIVRHPMYLALTVIEFAAALVLGSYWALIPSAAYPFLLAVRIRNEEALLERELPGYVDYEKKLRWRLVPGLW